ncbi:hypothetical protein AB0K04_13435 [Micromonospora coxensis]|uniref:hypothetical protein n=1 Tax=Micromonospora coxensis TaxID=356852 RepID=UPI003421C6B2
MRFRTVIGSVLASTLVAGAGLLTTTPAAARDTTTLIEGVTGLTDTAAAGGRVFVSANDRIVIADGRGAITGTITGLANPTGLAVTPDGARLYAALTGSGEVAEIDTTSLTVTRRIDLAAYPSPEHLSLAGDRLWVGYGVKGSFDGGVLGLDLSVPAPAPVQIATRMYGAPMVAAGGDTVVAGEAGINPGSLRVYDVRTAPATLRGTISGSQHGLSNLTDLTVTPDGATAISVFATSGFDVWDTTTLAKVRTYGTEAEYPGSPGAVALSADGAHVAGAFYGSMYSPYATVYDAATAEKTYQTNVTNNASLRTGSLSVLGDDLFALQEDRQRNRYYLWRVEGATLPASTLTLTAETGATALAPFSLTGRLAFTDGSAPGAQPLEITRTLPDGTTVLLPAVTTAADGTFRVTDTPPVGGAVTYGALWDGSPTFRWSKITTTVDVVRHATTLTLTGPSIASAGRPIQLTGVLGTAGAVPTPAGSVVVWRDVTTRSGTTSTDLPPVRLAADGSFTVTDTPPTSGQYRYHVRFDGDATFALAHDSHDISVRGAIVGTYTHR